MASIIARIKLNPGETGYYDEKTNIYLNWKHPVADVPLGADVSDLRRSVKAHRISIIAGSLGRAKTFKQVLMEAKSKRTGEPLDKLMGDTPLAKEPTKLIDATDDTKTVKTTETIVADVKSKVVVDKQEDKQPAMTETKEATETTEATKDTKEVTEEAKDNVVDKKTDKAVKEKEAAEPLTTTPGSFRSLKVGTTKDITASKTVTGAEVSNKKLADVVFDDKTVTIEAKKAGKVDVTIKSGDESVVVSGTIVDA